MNHNFSIRPAELADAAEIAALTGELGYPATVGAIRDRLEQVLGRENSLVLVAVSDGQVAGWLQANAWSVLETGFRAEVVGLVVGERFRRRGIGRLLIKQAERWAAEIGAMAIVIRSNTKRIESHHFYPALGYSVSKTQSVYRKNIPW